MRHLTRAIAEHIADATGDAFRAPREHSSGGGCISNAIILEDARRRFFVKLNQGPLVEMFAAEAAGLSEIQRTGAIRVPFPVCWGTAESVAYLVLEHIPFGRSTTSGLRELGRQLADMHRFTHDAFGWQRDNTIGSTAQINTLSKDWPEFWRQCRLAFQLELAARNGYRGRLQQQGDKVLEKLDRLFEDHRPQPSLLHGDLWGGNYSMDTDGNPVIYDPAVYYGDRETDLAMTELFGGFGREFYTAYDDAWPLPEGYRLRKTLYNLYHVLNHLNLFGGGYGSQAETMMDTLLARI